MRKERHQTNYVKLGAWGVGITAGLYILGGGGGARTEGQTLDITLGPLKQSPAITLYQRELKTHQSIIKHQHLFGKECPDDASDSEDLHAAYTEETRVNLANVA